MSKHSFLRLTLRTGTVYKMKTRAVRSDKPHFLVVLNCSPLSDQVIVLGVFSSQIEKSRTRVKLQGLPPETLVEVSPEEYSELRVPSVVDCSTPVQMPTENFYKELADKDKLEKLCDDLPEALCQRIINAVKACNTVEECIKRLL